MTYIIIYLIGIPLVGYAALKYCEVLDEPKEIKKKYTDSITIALLWPLMAFLALILIGAVGLIFVYVMIHGVVFLILQFLHISELFHGLFDKVEQTYTEEEKTDEE